MQQGGCCVSDINHATANVGDQGCPVFFEEFYVPNSCINGFLNLIVSLVEKVGDGGLFGEGRQFPSTIAATLLIQVTTLSIQLVILGRWIRVRWCFLSHAGGKQQVSCFDID